MFENAVINTFPYSVKNVIEKRKIYTTNLELDIGLNFLTNIPLILELT